MFCECSAALVVLGANYPVPGLSVGRGCDLLDETGSAYRSRESMMISSSAMPPLRPYRTVESRERPSPPETGGNRFNGSLIPTHCRARRHGELNVVAPPGGRTVGHACHGAANDLVGPPYETSRNRETPTMAKTRPRTDTKDSQISGRRA